MIVAFRKVGSVIACTADAPGCAAHGGCVNYRRGRMCQLLASQIT